MSHASALKFALELMHLPSQARSIRSAPLPTDVDLMLRIVSGDEDATIQATERTGRSRDVVREAAAFFIEQILLYPGADSYRVLGATPQASYRELRHNMALLLRWLHPDGDKKNHRAVLASRVTRAWNDLKTRERRVAYDRTQSAPKTMTSDFAGKSRGTMRSGSSHGLRHGRRPVWLWR